MFDPRFTCPECGRSPVLDDHTWDVIDKLRHGTLVPNKAYTCPAGHTWVCPIPVAPALAIGVRATTPEELEMLKKAGIQERTFCTKRIVLKGQRPLFRFSGPLYIREGK